MLGKKIVPPPEPPKKEVWLPYKRGFEICGKKLRTVDVDTQAEDYAREVARRSAP